MIAVCYNTTNFYLYIRLCTVFATTAGTAAVLQDFTVIIIKATLFVYLIDKKGVFILPALLLCRFRPR